VSVLCGSCAMIRAADKVVLEAARAQLTEAGVEVVPA
jgi:hypothetical protein